MKIECKCGCGVLVHPDLVRVAARLDDVKLPVTVPEQEYCSGMSATAMLATIEGLEHQVAEAITAIQGVKFNYAIYNLNANRWQVIFKVVTQTEETLGW